MMGGSSCRASQGLVFLVLITLLASAVACGGTGVTATSRSDPGQARKAERTPRAPPVPQPSAASASASAAAAPAPPPTEQVETDTEASAAAEAMASDATSGHGAASKVPLDHSTGTPLHGVCDLRLVKWKDTPTLFGLEQFVSVSGEAEAKRLRVRSYAVEAPRYMANGKDGSPTIAVIAVSQWAPDGDTGVKNWGEVYLFSVRNCVVGSTVVMQTGPRQALPSHQTGAPVRPR